MIVRLCWLVQFNVKSWFDIVVFLFQSQKKVQNNDLIFLEILLWSFDGSFNVAFLQISVKLFFRKFIAGFFFIPNSIAFNDCRRMRRRWFFHFRLCFYPITCPHGEEWTFWEVHKLHRDFDMEKVRKDHFRVVVPIPINWRQILCSDQFSEFVSIRNFPYL